MFKVLVLQTLYTLSDDATEYQLKDRLSFMRFCGLALHDPVPDAKTIWLYREQLTRADAIARLFARFDAILRARGSVAMGGQIVDATVIEARRPRLNRAEKRDDQGRRRAPGLEQGAHPADRPRRPVDAETRQEAPPFRGQRRDEAGDDGDRHPGVRL
jgi:transposase, IS5 family